MESNTEMNLGPNIIQMIYNMSQNNLILYDIDIIEKNNIVNGLHLKRKVPNKLNQILNDILISKLSLSNIKFFSGIFTAMVYTQIRSAQHNGKTVFHLYFIGDSSIYMISYEYNEFPITYNLTMDANNKLLDFFIKSIKCILCEGNIDIILDNSHLVEKNSCYNDGKIFCGCGLFIHPRTPFHSMGWMHNNCLKEITYNCAKCNAVLYGLNNIGSYKDNYPHIKCDICTQITCNKCTCMHRCSKCYDVFCENNGICIYNGDQTLCVCCIVIAPCCKNVFPSDDIIKCNYCNKSLSCMQCFPDENIIYTYSDANNCNEYWCINCDNEINYHLCNICNKTFHINRLVACHKCEQNYYCPDCIDFPYIQNEDNEYLLSEYPHCKNCIEQKMVTLSVAKII